MISKRLLVISACSLLLTLTTGCTGELRKENAELAKAKATLEIEITKKGVEMDGLRQRLSEAMKQADQLSERLVRDQKDSAVIRTKLSDAQSEVVLLRTQLQSASEQSRGYEERAATLQKELEGLRADALARDKAEKNKVTVDFQASVTFRSGDTKPVASTEFFLLRRSLEEISNETGVKGDGADIYQGIAFLVTNPFPKQADLERRAKLYGAMKKYLVASFKSNMAGMASPENLQAGRYWVFGAATMAQSTILWNCEVTLQAGTNKIYLDVENAAYAL